MKQCFGYVRVSTVKQGDGVSLVAQREAIEAFASRHNIEIVKWFEEKETAAKRGRPLFNLMVKQLQRGKAHGLVIHKIDRSARNFADWAKIGDLQDAGIDIHFATESLDFRSRGGRLNARLRDEFLNETIFTSLAHARQELEAWRHDYNHFRPHSSLGNRTPAEMGSGSSGKPYWGHAPNTVVAITPSNGHQNGHRLYS